MLRNVVVGCAQQDSMALSGIRLEEIDAEKQTILRYGGCFLCMRLERWDRVRARKGDS
jgi:hypothetical protein